MSETKPQGPNDELEALYHISNSINISISVDKICQRIVNRCVQYVDADQGAIYLHSETEGERDKLLTFVREAHSEEISSGFHFRGRVLGWMVKNRKLLICNNPTLDSELFEADLAAAGINSMLAAPLLNREHFVGALVLFNKRSPGGFTNRDGRFLGMVGVQAAKVIENATLHERQGRLISQMQLDRLAALARLVAGVAHEMNTPLGAALSSASQLKQITDRVRSTLDGLEGKQEIPVDTLLKDLDLLSVNEDVVSRAAEKLSVILTRLQEFVRLDQAERKKARINDCLDQSLFMLEKDLSEKMIVNRNYSKLPQIACYPGQLNQVFFNTLLNALQSIEGDGKIDISASTDKTDITVEISDNGCGIQPEFLSRVFDPGFTTKGVGYGLGLGLPISHEIIQRHQGYIHIDSDYGRGTRVTIKLPHFTESSAKSL